jgi:hypothetical protein
MHRVLPLFLMAVACFGQDFRKHNVQFVAGAGLPRGDLKNLLSSSGGIGFGYGYRPIRYLMAEAGYETLFGAARIRDFEPTYFGSLRIRDYQQFLPFGGRVIMPLADDRVQIYGGGGGVYIRYSERISQPFQGSGYRVSCVSCALRDGVGYYAVVGVSVGIDRSQFFRLGAGTKVYRGATSGDPLGPVPGVETRDRWYNIFATLGISF